MIRMRIVEERGRSLGHGWRELRGKKGPADVVIRLKSQTAASTRVEVTARRGLAEYDEGVAERVLDATAGAGTRAPAAPPPGTRRTRCWPRRRARSGRA